jgi:hypothetical protein
MKKIIIGGVALIVVIGVGVGFGFSYFASSKIDEALTQSIEIAGFRFKPGPVETSIGFLNTSKIIKNSKLTLKEATFELPEMTINVDTSQVQINIPNVEGELPDGVKFKGADAILSAPVLSDKDNFMVDFEVKNVIASAGGIQASAKILKGDIAKEDKSLDFNSLSVSLSQLNWNAENPGSGGVENLIYNEKLALVSGKINSEVFLSADKFKHSESLSSGRTRETALESVEVKAKYSAKSKDSNLSTPFILQEINKNGFENVLQEYQLELINGDISTGEVKIRKFRADGSPYDDFFSLGSFSYHEIVDRVESKHKADLKIDLGNIDTPEFKSKLSNFHTKLQVETSTSLPTTLVLLEEITKSNYNDFIRSRKPDVELLKIKSQDGTFSEKGKKTFSYSSIDADLTRLLQGDVAKADINFMIQNMDIFSRKGILKISQISLTQKTSIPQKSFNRLYTLDEKLSEVEAAELFFELIEKFQFTPKISLGNVELILPNNKDKGVLLKKLSALADLNFDKGNGNVSVELKTSVSKLLNLRSIGSPIGFDDLTLRLKIALSKVAVGAWKEGIHKSIKDKKESPALDKAIQDMIKLKPELVFEIEGGQENLNVLMASLSFKLDRGTPKSIRFKKFTRDPLEISKKIFYKHGSTNLKVDIRDKKALTSMIDKSFKKPGLTEIYLSENKRFFESGENSLKMDLLIKGDEVMLNGKNSEELSNMNEMFIKN